MSTLMAGSLMEGMTCSGGLLVGPLVSGPDIDISAMPVVMSDDLKEPLRETAGVDFPESSRLDLRDLSDLLDRCEVPVSERGSALPGRSFEDSFPMLY